MIKKIWNYIMKFVTKTMDDHVGAYAAQSAYFIILSFIPFLLLLLTLVRYLPITEANITEWIVGAVPESFQSLLSGIIQEVYEKSSAIVPITAIFALWSAGKGFQALTNGLNVINDAKETRNYFYMRIRSIAYTIIFIVAIVITLILLVFGRSIQRALVEYWPFVADITDFILRFSTIITMFVLGVAFLLFYTFLPNRHLKMKNELPGAMLTAVAWAGFSFGFSVYFDHLSGFANMYGSLTTILLVMLWLYFCMYLFLIGAEINVHLEEQPDTKEEFKLALEEMKGEMRERKKAEDDSTEDDGSSKNTEKNVKYNSGNVKIKQKK